LDEHTDQDTRALRNDPVELNEAGDVVVRDPRTLRLLAHGDALTVLEHLQRHGASTATEVCSATGISRDHVDAALTDLAASNLAVRPTDDQGAGALWSGVGTGVYFEIPTHGEGAAAGRQLTNTMLLRNEAVPRTWVREVEPGLTDEWARAAGMFNANVVMSSDELERLQLQLEELLAPFTTREPAHAPAGARKVRVLTFFLPGPGA
jgi:hypothetical protein